MKETLINFETVKLAKEKGFSGYCNGYFYKNTGKTKGLYCYYSDGLREENYSDSLSCQAPTQSLLQRWLREVHNMFVYVDETGRPYIKDINSKTIAEICDNGKYAGFKYEEALEMALFKGLELIN